MLQTVKILGVTYKVEEVPCVSKEALRMGQVDHIRKVISIDSALTEQGKQVTLMHEILHCILHSLGYYDEHDNETFVQGMASALYQVLVENKLF
ncbi:MAG: ImmA/IrrE family metallo-endopeptidase [Peptococcaceae bacterium]|nr:ImmA/IrrE family metallo-endopeptidase [Peptococcaceae bacterium]